MWDELSGQADAFPARECLQPLQKPVLLLRPLGLVGRPRTNIHEASGSDKADKDDRRSQ